MEDIKAAIDKYVKGRVSCLDDWINQWPREARRRNGNSLTWFEWQISENFGLDIVNFIHKKGIDLAIEMAPKEATHLYITL